MEMEKMKENIDKIFSVLGKISFELISLNSHFYRESILVIESEYITK